MEGASELVMRILFEGWVVWEPVRAAVRSNHAYLGVAIPAEHTKFLRGAAERRLEGLLGDDDGRSAGHGHRAAS